MKKGPFIALVGAALLAAGIYFLPRTAAPADAEAAGHEHHDGEASALSDDELVMEAVRKLEDGTSPPMEAIMQLRQVVERNPQHLLGNYYLGYFAVVSGQWEKAAERLEATLKIDAAYAPAHRLLGDVYVQLGSIEEAKSHYTEFLNLTTDQAAKEEVTGKLNELKLNT